MKNLNHAESGPRLSRLIQKEKKKKLFRLLARFEAQILYFGVVTIYT